MKLKKIASLMLAGIMAVSMLTACGGNGETGGETGGNTGNTITTSTAVSALSNAVKAYTSATIDVKESALMNGRLDKFFSDNTYAEIEELGGGDASIQDEVESIFGEEMDELTAEKLKDNKDTSNYYFKAIEVKNVSDATALVKAANNVGEILKAADLHDEYIVDIDGTTLTSNSRKGGHGKPDFGGPDFDVDFDITIGDMSVSYTADYTMYVEQVTANVAGDSSVPVVIVVLKTDIAKKV